MISPTKYWSSAQKLRDQSNQVSTAYPYTSGTTVEEFKEEEDTYLAVMPDESKKEEEEKADIEAYHLILAPSFTVNTLIYVCIDSKALCLGKIEIQIYSLFSKSNFFKN